MWGVTYMSCMFCNVLSMHSEFVSQDKGHVPVYTYGKKQSDYDQIDDIVARAEEVNRKNWRRSTCCRMLSGARALPLCTFCAQVHTWDVTLSHDRREAWDVNSWTAAMWPSLCSPHLSHQLSARRRCRASTRAGVCVGGQRVRRVRWTSASHPATAPRRRCHWPTSSWKWAPWWRSRPTRGSLCTGSSAGWVSPRARPASGPGWNWWDTLTFTMLYIKVYGLRLFAPFQMEQFNKKVKCVYICIYIYIYIYSRLYILYIQYIMYFYLCSLAYLCAWNECPICA